MSGGLSPQATVVAALLAIVFFGAVFELIRRRRLQERYALLWMVAAALMLVGVLASHWTLTTLSSLTGITDTSVAILSLLLFFVLVILLHQTTVNSRLSEQNTRLMQEMALLRAEVETASRQKPAKEPPRPRGSREEAPGTRP